MEKASRLQPHSNRYSSSSVFHLSTISRALHLDIQSTPNLLGTQTAQLNSPKPLFRDSLFPRLKQNGHYWLKRGRKVRGWWTQHTRWSWDSEALLLSQGKGRVRVAQVQPIGPAGARLHGTHADSKTGKGHKLKHGKFQLHSRIFNPIAFLVSQLVVFFFNLEQAAGRRGFEMFRTPVPAPIRPVLGRGPDWITPRDPFQPKCQFHDFYCQFGCFLSKR